HRTPARNVPSPRDPAAAGERKGTFQGDFGLRVLVPALQFNWIARSRRRGVLKLRRIDGVPGEAGCVRFKGRRHLQWCFIKARGPIESRRPPRWHTILWRETV